MSEKTSGSEATPNQAAVDTYSAYLIARATGRPPVTRGRTTTVGEQYAVALGVEHFFKGTPTMTARELLDQTTEACIVPKDYDENAEEPRDLGPSPPDPGVDLGPTPPDPGIAAPPLAKLAAVLDPNCDRCISSEEAVDEAIRLIKSADERAAYERAACVEWLCKYPNAPPEILAQHLKDGRHRL